MNYGGIMRRVIIIVIALAVMAGITASVYLLYKYNKEEVLYDDLNCIERRVDEDNVFSAKFACTKDTMRICGAKYKVSDGTLYITVLATAGDEGIFPTDNKGYAKVTFSPDEQYSRVVYLAGGEEEELDFQRK